MRKVIYETPNGIQTTLKSARANAPYTLKVVDVPEEKYPHTPERERLLKERGVIVATKEHGKLVLEDVANN